MDEWDSIATDPEFQAQPEEVKLRVARNYFSRNIDVDPSFIEAQKQQPDLRDKVWAGFVKTVVPKERWDSSYQLDPTLKENLVGFGEFIGGAVRSGAKYLESAVETAGQPAPEAVPEEPAKPQPEGEGFPAYDYPAESMQQAGEMGGALTRAAVEGFTFLPRMAAAGTAGLVLLGQGKSSEEAKAKIQEVLEGTSTGAMVPMSETEKNILEVLSSPFKTPEAAVEAAVEKFPELEQYPSLLASVQTVAEAVMYLAPFRGVIRGAIEPSRLYKARTVAEWSPEQLRTILRATDESVLDPQMLDAFKSLPGGQKALAIKKAGLTLEEVSPSILGRVLGAQGGGTAMRVGEQPAATAPEAAADRGLALPKEAEKSYAGPERRSDGAARANWEKLSPEERYKLAYEDHLTGLSNRRAFDEAVKAGEHDSGVTFVADLDAFKGVNDTFGHGTGDLVLRAMGEAAKEVLGQESTAGLGYRTGGDEFTFHFKSQARGIAAMEQVRSILEASTVEVQLPDGSIETITAKELAEGFGLSYGWGVKDGKRSAYENADALLYERKRAGKAARAAAGRESEIPAPAEKPAERVEAAPHQPAERQGGGVTPAPEPLPTAPEKPLQLQSRREVTRNLAPSVRVEGVGTFQAPPGTTVHAGVDLPPEVWEAVDRGAAVENGWWDHSTGTWLSNGEGRALLDRLLESHRTAIRTALEQGQHVPLEILAEYPELLPKPDPQPTEQNIVSPKVVPTLKELEERGGYLTDKDDLQGIIRQHGDLVTYLKDVNGGKAVMPLSLAIRVLEDTVASQYVSTAAVGIGRPADTNRFIFDPYTVPNMPAFAAALVRLFSDRLAELPASILEAGKVPPSQQPIGPEEEPAGLPLLAPEQIVAQGKPSWAVTARGSRIEVQYLVVEADALVASHTGAFRKNPLYPSELQPRAREREAMRQQIEGPQGIMAKLVPELLGESLKADDGAPIIGEDGVVESGNGRTIALKRLYETDHQNAIAYRNWLAQHAAQFGVPQLAIDEANRPVLVRLRTTAMDMEARKRFAAEANQTLVAEMSPTEKAMGDASRMSDELMTMFVPDESGNINTAANREFLARFMEEVVGPDKGQYLMADGRSWNDAGIKRARNAVFAKAYGNVEAVTEIIESADVNIKNIGNAMLAVAPRLAQVASDIAKGHLYDLNLGGAVAEAAVKMSALRKASPPITVEMFLAQYGLFGKDISDDAVAVLRMFDANKRSGKKIAAVLNRYLNLVEGAGSPSQFNMFGKATPPSRLELLERAQRQVAQEGGDAPTPTLFTEGTSVGKTVLRDAAGAAAKAGAPSAPTPETPTREERVKELNAAGVELGGVNDLLPEIIDLPELVALAKGLMGGKYPRVVRNIGKGTRGLFGYKQEGSPRGAVIKILASLYNTDTATGQPLSEDVGLMRLKMTLAHEIGHLKDWLPDFVIHGRGNILGRIASLLGYLDDMLQHTPQSVEKLISEDERKTLLQQAQKDARKEIPPVDRETGTKEDRKARLKEVAKRAQEIYAKKLAEEAGRRKLITRDEVMKELKTVSMDWKPFDPAANPGYTAYRFSSPELYADAGSVLMNDPNRLARLAPKFYEAWKAWLGNKPQVKALYEQIQREIKTGKVVELRQERRYAGYEKGEKAMAAKRAKEKTTFQDVVSLLKRELVDTNTGIIHRVKAMQERTGHKVDPENNPIYWIEEMVYSSAEARAYLGNLEAVLKNLNEVGVSWEQLGSYLEDRRIIAERRQLANPEGITPQAALDSIRLLKKQLGPEKWLVLNEQAQAFRDSHRYIVDKYREAEMVGPALQAYMDANAHYVTFAVEAYYSANYGAGITAHIFKQHGTFANILNPATATLMKDIAMIKAANRKLAAKATVEFLMQHFPDEIVPADRVWNGRRRVPLPPKDPKQALLIFPHQGKLAAFYVPKEVGRTFEQNSAEASIILDAGRFTNQLFRELFVQKNPGFWTFNILRDTKRATINLPGASLAKMLPYFYQALKPGFRRGFNIPDPVIDAMERGKMLISVEDPWAISTEDKGVEAMLRRFERGDKVARNIHDKTWRKFFGWLDAVGHSVETTTKVAGYQYLKSLRDADGSQLYSEKEIGHMVRVFAGSPDFMRKGSAYPIYNNMFLFSNAIKEGFRGDYEAMKLSPAEWWWKNVKYNLLPKMLMYAGVIGLLGYEMKKLYENVSAYDMANYIVVPLGRTKDGSASVVLRIPMDETGRFIAGAMWKALNLRKAKDIADLFDFMAGQAPNLSPAIGVPVQVVQYLLGQNPYDWFRGRYMIDEDRFKAGGWASHREFLKQLSNEVGLGLFYRFETQEPRAVRNELERVLRWPIVSNILGRFVKVTDQGQREKFREVAQEQQQIAAQRNVAIRDAIIEDLSSDRPRGATNVAMDLMKRGIAPGTAEDFNRRYQEAIVRLKGSAALAAFVKARSKEEKAAILLKVLRDAGGQ